MPHKNRKKEDIPCFEVLDVLFSQLEASLIAWRPFWASKPWIQIRIRIETSADLQHWMLRYIRIDCI